MKLKKSVCIEAPVEKVWTILADVANVQDWVGVINRSYCEGELTQGIGTVRVCHLTTGTTIKEEWIAWEEGQSFTYQAENAPMMKSAKNTWSVQAVGENTLLTTESEVILKGGFLGRLFEPIMRLMTGRMGDGSLAGFKYLVENGKRFEGKLSNLPKIRTVC